MAQVSLPAPLREYAGGEAEVRVPGSTVSDALVELTRRHPRLRRHLFDDAGRLRGYVKLYVNEDEVADVNDKLDSGDTLVIVPSIAGGRAVAEALSAEERARYSRHLSLPQVGLEGQMKLREARIAVVGAGGLGAPVGLYLAAAGIGTIGLIDDDAVDVTNLQRQVLYTEADVGRAKTEAAAERLNRLNPHVRVVQHRVRLTSGNALDVLAHYDVVIDGTDNFPTRYLVNDACVLLGKPYVYGSIFRFDGQVSVFDARTGPCYRCLFREPPPPDLVPNCAEGGVLGVLPGIIGSAQALEAMKIVVGTGETLAGRLAVFDALTFRWRELKLRKNPDCPVCGDHPTITGLIDYDEFCGTKGPSMEQPAGVAELTAEDLKRRLDAGEPIALIDVREPFEWQISNLEAEGARLIPMGELIDRLDELDPAAETVFYCRTGARSRRVAEYLAANGFARVANLKGGINAWATDVDPSLPTY